MPRQLIQPEQQLTLGELLESIDLACARMGKKNAHRHLLKQCKSTIVHLASRLPDEPTRTRSGLILP